LLLKSLVEASVERKRCVMSNEMYTPRWRKDVRCTA
jgi:hypothetical protein